MEWRRVAHLRGVQLLRDIHTTERRTLYPEFQPYETGHLDVGDGHSLYWELIGQSGRQAGSDASWRTRRRFEPRPPAAVEPGQVQDPRLRPARLRQVHALCEPRGEHDLAPGRRHREAADRGREGRQVDGLRRKLGLDALARLRPEISGALHRTGPSRHLPVRPLRDRLAVQGRRSELDLSGRMGGVRLDHPGERARRPDRRLMPSG